MLLRKGLYIFVLILISSLTTVGCSSTKVNNINDLTFYTLNIDGDKEPYPEDCDDIREIKELSSNYIVARAGGDYSMEYNGNEFEYYIDEMKKIFEESNAIDITNDYIQTNKLIIEVDNLNIQKCEIYTVLGEEHCKIVVEYITTTIEGTDEYFANNEIEKGARYSRTMILELSKENNVWKVAELVDVTPKVKVE